MQVADVTWCRLTWLLQFMHFFLFIGTGRILKHINNSMMFGMAGVAHAVEEYFKSICLCEVYIFLETAGYECWIM